MAERNLNSLVQRLEHDQVVTLRTGTGANGWDTNDNYVFKNNGRIKMMCVTAVGTPTVTVQTPQKTKGTPSLDIPDYTRTLVANQTRTLGPFEPTVYNDADGNVDFSVGTGTGLSMALIQD